MNLATTISASLLSLTLPMLPARAAVIHVPAEEPSIQAGVDAAADGDTVRVACGTYYEHDIGIEDRAVVVQGATGSPRCVTVDAQGLGRIFILDNARNSVFEGLTLKNATTALDMTSHSYSVSIRDCVFQDATSRAIGAHQSGANFARCQFRGNNGVASASDGGNLAFTDCLILDNASPSYQGVILVYYSSLLLQRCILAGNTGVCLTAGQSGHVTIRESTFFRNESCFNAESGGEVFIHRSITAFNDVIGGCNHYAAFGATCVDSYGNTVNDWPACNPPAQSDSTNFSADPLFCDAENGDLGLRPSSPCLPGNHPGGATCGVIGAIGLECGEAMRPLAVRRESWGSVKSGYR